MLKDLFTWIIAQAAALSAHLERTNDSRFNRWAKFLGRKMFLCLVAMLLLTLAFLTALICALIWGGVEAMKALGSELWTAYVTAICGLYGTGVTGNAFEHSATAKVKIAQGPPPAPKETTETGA